MAQKKRQLRRILETLYKKYNRRKLIAPDPLQFVYKFRKKRDREIAALLAASLAYGNVRQIENDLNKLFTLIGDNPYEFTIKFNKHKRNKLRSFKHRFNTGNDIADLFRLLKIILEEYWSLEDFFLEGYFEHDTSIIPALTSFVERLYIFWEYWLDCEPSKGLQYLITNPANGSVCKRLNMFLRWMVRKDDVDPGPWKLVDKTKLIIPVDTHMARLCRILGLYKRKALSINSAIEITESFKKINADDPVKYDFALSRIGIIENCTGKLKKQCESCELFPFCKKLLPR